MRGVFAMALLGLGTVAHAESRRPVVVELFSSEGCSSCPPADSVLRALDREQPIANVEVIALEFHVDYWNRLGWADPFSSASFSERQSDYARAMDRDGVYTPQAVVDGASEGNGADRGKLESLIAQASKRATGTVQLARAADKLRVQAKAPGDAEVWLAIVERGLATDVPRGENAGEHLEHGPVVRKLQQLGVLRDGAFEASVSATLPHEVKAERARFVVFVQERASRHIIAAAALDAR